MSLSCRAWGVWSHLSAIRNIIRKWSVQSFLSWSLTAITCRLSAQENLHAAVELITIEISISCRQRYKIIFTLTRFHVQTAMKRLTLRACGDLPQKNRRTCQQHIFSCIYLQLWHLVCKKECTTYLQQYFIMKAVLNARNINNNSSIFSEIYTYLKYAIWGETKCIIY